MFLSSSGYVIFAVTVLYEGGLTMEHGIVLFDGECNLCSKSVQFLLKRDRDDYFRFTSLQGPAGQALLEQYSIPKNMESIVYIEGRHAYTESDAVIKIAGHLDRYRTLAAIFRLLPRPFRDFLYRRVANNRYKIWGKNDSCMLPTAQNRNKFI